MRERQPQGTALATCFVAPHVVERAEAEVDDNPSPPPHPHHSP